jgi:hypothetical protein
MLSSFVLEGKMANWSYVMQPLDSALWLWNNRIRCPLQPWPFAMPLSCSVAIWMERFVLMTCTDIVPSRRWRRQLQCRFCHLYWIQVVKLLRQERQTRFISTCGFSNGKTARCGACLLDTKRRTSVRSKFSKDWGHVGIRFKGWDHEALGLVQGKSFIRKCSACFPRGLCRVLIRRQRNLHRNNRGSIELLEYWRRHIQVWNWCS